jgi:hypothetical protein
LRPQTENSEKLQNLGDSNQPLSSSEVPVELKPFDLPESQNVKRETLMARN